MTTVKCPKCDERVRMPADASPEARVQCPLCVEEFELSAALDQLAPMLVVLDDPARAHAGVASTARSFAGSDLVAESESEGDTPEFSFEAPAAGRAAAPAFSFEDGAATAGKSGAASSRRGRSQRPQKSAVKEILKVVGGGVIGLTIGQLILWWLPGKLKKDPFELGPKIPSYLSFLVSPEFRGGPVAKQDPGSGQQRNTAGSELPGSFGGFNSGGVSELPSSSFEGIVDPNEIPAEKKKKKNGKSTSKTSLSENGSTPVSAAPADDGEQTTNVDVNADPLAPLASEEDIFGGKPEIAIPMINLPALPTDPTDPKPSPPNGSGDSTPAIKPPPSTLPTGEPNTTTPNTTPTGEFHGVRNAPAISLDQLSTRLSGAVSASLAMDTSSAEPQASQLTLAKDFYLTLAGLGEAVTFVDQAAAADQFQEVGKLAVEVGQQAAKLELIGKVAPSWMKNSRPHNGVVVCGSVESIEFADPYYVTSLVMPNKTVLQVVSRNDPAGDYKPQNKLLVLGSILDAPLQNLENYQGDATTVILDGLHATLPNSD